MEQKMMTRQALLDLHAELLRLEGVQLPAKLEYAFARTLELLKEPVRDTRQRLRDAVGRTRLGEFIKAQDALLDELAVFKDESGTYIYRTQEESIHAQAESEKLRASFELPLEAERESRDAQVGVLADVVYVQVFQAPLSSLPDGLTPSVLSRLLPIIDDAR